ncbi:glycoside hydrolase family 18 protein [Atractiella rhizophila]|nr:glycoside hydrolase family 18 protein [Atractiella rhizophila]KAH8928577.1 glycoside hydrolase family 18 protein [Atractiella rhizophila]
MNTYITAALSLLASSALALPVVNGTASILAQNPPHFAIYSDNWSNMGAPPNATALDGWNAFLLSFWTSGRGPLDMAQGWVSLTDEQRAAYRAEYDAVGAKLIISAYGSTESPTTAGVDPITAANELADFVKTYNLHGADLDYEDFDAFNGGTAEDWLITMIKQLRTNLGPDYIITSAPLAPWFADNGKYPGGGYVRIHEEVGDQIDWYNVQFYNQNDYTTCESLLNTSGSQWPHTSLFEIVAKGVPADKLLIGKPASTGDASNGYVDPATLATCVQQAKGKGWNAGLMVWQYPNQPIGYVSTVWGS